MRSDLTDITVATLVRTMERGLNYNYCVPYNGKAWKVSKAVWDDRFDEFPLRENPPTMIRLLLQEMLLQEEWRDKHFVEASPIDTKWGIGLAEGNPLCENEANWKGRNLLGKCLDKVRDVIERENGQCK